MLKNKTIVLGVTGSIAAYKAASLASALRKQHADVHVVMTRSAAEFISPLTFETLTGNMCVKDMFDHDFVPEVLHISLAQKADLIMVAPATASVIAKAAHGIADDMLTAVLLAATCPVMIAPAMNTHMYENPATQENLETLRRRGYDVIDPAFGLLACGDVGKGKMPEPDFLLDCILDKIAMNKDLAGRSVLVTAGPTQESIDPVRYITNHSSGKMGYAIARICRMRGADVTLVSGETALDTPYGVTRIDVKSAEDMYDAVMKYAPDADMIFKAAAVADYTPETTADHKIKKKDGDLSIPLRRTHDILGELAKIRKDSQIICGFSMETENLVENSRAKLQKKSLDMICANSLRTEGAGFRTDTNVVTVITANDMIELGKLSKLETASRIVDIALTLK
ncbi:MAG: bifunctional phosphopantothenoylcysteine decarboxylase/phosphopantothenate--cysteine ligase CoaBC [Mogibacterium sp.]|nr:bifunctional phosphopantothenoylcysteine decarboxylase/phosphopantothenate--cysteine ligase CoaBC [Mogibacterium sp.]